MAVPWVVVVGLLLVLAARTSMIVLASLVAIYSRDARRRAAAYRVLAALGSKGPHDRA